MDFDQKSGWNNNNRYGYKYNSCRFGCWYNLYLYCNKCYFLHFSGIS